MGYGVWKIIHAKFGPRTYTFQNENKNEYLINEGNSTSSHEMPKMSLECKNFSKNVVKGMYTSILACIAKYIISIFYTNIVVKSHSRTIRPSWVFELPIENICKLCPLHLIAALKLRFELRSASMHIARTESTCLAMNIDSDFIYSICNVQ